MKVQVRDGFVVHFVERSKQGDGSVLEREYKHYPEDGPVDLDEKRVREHAHKLEPASKEAEKFLAALHVPEATATTQGAPGIDVAAIAAAASAATVKALQDAGVIPAAAA